MQPTRYIAGPITGNPAYRAEFAAAEFELQQRGYLTINPARSFPLPTPLHAATPAPPTWHDWMRRALVNLSLCDGVALLSGWEASRGARWERDIAEMIAIPVRTVAAWTTRQVTL